MPDSQLRDAFVDAFDNAPPSTIAITKAVNDGRRRVRTRRIATGTTSALAVVLVAAGLTALLHGSPLRLPTPVASSPAPIATNSQAPSASVPFLLGNVVTLPDHTEVTLAPPSSQVDQVVQTSDGFVFSTGTDVWFQPNAGPRRKISATDGGFAVARDGKAVVIVGAGSVRVTAFALPAMSELAHVDVTSGSMGTRIRQVNGDWALLTAFDGGPGSSPAEAWNYRTGQVIKSTTDIWALGIDNRGNVMRGLDNGSKQAGITVTKTCYDLVPLTSSRTSGYCTNPMVDGLAAAFALSPDGKWLAAPRNWNRDGYSAAFLSVDALHRGVYDAILAPQVDAVVRFWEDNTTFIMQSSIGVYQPGRNLLLAGESAWYECRLPVGCETLPVPSGATVIQVMG